MFQQVQQSVPYPLKLSQSQKYTGDPFFYSLWKDTWFDGLHFYGPSCLYDRWYWSPKDDGMFMFVCLHSDANNTVPTQSLIIHIGLIEGQHNGYTMEICGVTHCLASFCRQTDSKTSRNLGTLLVVYMYWPRPQGRSASILCWLVELAQSPCYLSRAFHDKLANGRLRNNTPCGFPGDPLPP